MPLTKLRALRRIVIFVAACMAVVGGAIMLAPDSAYTSGSFKWTFEYVPRRVWGAVFFVSAALTTASNATARIGGPILTAASAAWGLTLVAAVLTGDSQSWTGWVYLVIVTGILLLCRPYRRDLPA